MSPNTKKNTQLTCLLLRKNHLNIKIWLPSKSQWLQKQGPIVMSIKKSQSPSIILHTNSQTFSVIFASKLRLDEVNLIMQNTQ